MFKGQMLWNWNGSARVRCREFVDCRKNFVDNFANIVVRVIFRVGHSRSVDWPVLLISCDLLQHIFSSWTHCA